MVSTWEAGRGCRQAIDQLGQHEAEREQTDPPRLLDESEFPDEPGDLLIRLFEGGLQVDELPGSCLEWISRRSGIRPGDWPTWNEAWAYAKGAPHPHDVGTMPDSRRWTTL